MYSSCRMSHARPAGGVDGVVAGGGLASDQRRGVQQALARFNHIRAPVPKTFERTPTGAVFYTNPLGKRVYVTDAHLKGLVRAQGQTLGGLLAPVPLRWLVPYVRSALRRRALFWDELSRAMQGLLA